MQFRHGSFPSKEMASCKGYDKLRSTACKMPGNAIKGRRLSIARHFGLAYDFAEMFICETFLPSLSMETKNLEITKMTLMFSKS
jgi:hypothetical protein